MYARPHIETHSRGKGQSAVAGAAYRLGVALDDERTGMRHDFTGKGGVVWSAQLADDDAPAWQRDPAQFWNRVELAEKHPRAQVARDYRIPVPLGFDQEHAKALAESVARKIGAELNAPVSIALHRDNDRDRFGMEKDEETRGFHAHLYLPCRGVEAEGMAKNKAGIFRDLSNCKQSGQIIDRWAEVWAAEATRLAQAQGLEKSFDHRSYERQGLDLKPEIKMGVSVVEMERRGVESRKGTEAAAAAIARGEWWERTHPEEAEAQRVKAVADAAREAWRNDYRHAARVTRAEAEQAKARERATREKQSRARVEFDRLAAAYDEAKTDRDGAGAIRRDAEKDRNRWASKFGVLRWLTADEGRKLQERVLRAKKQEREKRKARDATGEACRSVRDTHLAAWQDHERAKIEAKGAEAEARAAEATQRAAEVPGAYERAQEQEQAREKTIGERLAALKARPHGPAAPRLETATPAPQRPGIGRRPSLGR